MATVFISYSRDDADAVGVLAEDIRSLGHTPWLDRELTGGQRWWDHILQEIRECDAFLSSVSASAMDSRACLSEYEYAVALGKPIVPVMVERGVADSLMPPPLAELQRIDYTAGDKRAFAALNRALATVPPAGPLPDPLPPLPSVPASYLFDLKTEIDSSTAMASDTQFEMVKQLRARMEQGHSSADLLSLVARFRQRDDVLVRVDQELAAFQQQLEQRAAAAPRPSHEPPPPQAAPAYSASPPPGQQAYQAPQPQPEPQYQGPQYQAAPPVTPGAGQPQASSAVSAWWWAAPIVGGLVGGLIAFFAVRGANANTARNMLILGGVMSVFWAVAFSGG